MDRFEIQPVLSCTLPAAAVFLHNWRQREAASTAPQQLRESAANIDRRLRWLLLENPVAVEGSPLGYCLRDSLGAIRGITLCFPGAFISASSRMSGLCSGSFFVEASARSMGFYLFRKYLSTPGYSFFFATTCNANSGELWEKVGGRPVPNSDIEYFLPLKLDVLMPSFVATKTSSEVAAEIATMCGRCANPILRLLTRPSAQLAVEPCQDWEKLSELSRRNRPRACITSDRSPEFLQWRYGPGSPHHPCEIYLFRDKQGNEGWFSLGNLYRGDQGQIRSSVLLDVIWPREKMRFKGVFQEIVRMAASGSDALFFRPHPGLDYRDYSPLIMARRFASPRAFVIMRKGAPPMPLDALDYDDNDYGAWAFQWQSAGRQPALATARSAAPGSQPDKGREARAS